MRSKLFDLPKSLDILNPPVKTELDTLIYCTSGCYSKFFVVYLILFCLFKSATDGFF